MGVGRTAFKRWPCVEAIVLGQARCLRTETRPTGVPGCKSEGCWNGWAAKMRAMEGRALRPEVQDDLFLGRVRIEVVVKEGGMARKRELVARKKDAMWEAVVVDSG